MSRIFDALQKSKLEGESPDFPLMSSLAEGPLANEMAEMEREIRDSAPSFVPSFAPNQVPDFVPDFAPNAVPNAVPNFVPNPVPDFAQDLAPDFAPNDVRQFKSLAISPAPNSRLVSLTDQASLGAEKFRFLGVRLRQLQQSRSLRQLLITSTIPEEGKSMVSVNLAVTLAQRKQKVLLLEGDLRRPSLSPRLGLPALPGLSEWLQSDLRQITNIYQLEGAGFWFLPAGLPPDTNLDLMHPERLSELMKQLAAWFDWILIDSPPLVPLADTSVWMRSADGILLVVREGTTHKRQLKRGLQILQRSKLLGVVLNSATNLDHDNYYQRYGPIPPKSSPAKSRIDEQNLG
jgi:capsular exopolysaccharide synthesis family protein